MVIFKSPVNTYLSVTSCTSLKKSFFSCGTEPWCSSCTSILPSSSNFVRTRSQISTLKPKWFQNNNKEIIKLKWKESEATRKSIHCLNVLLEETVQKNPFAWQKSMNIWVYEYLQAAGTCWGVQWCAEKLPSNCIFFFSAATSLFQPSKQQPNSKAAPLYQGTQFLLKLKGKQRLSNKYGGLGIWVNPTLLTLTVYGWHLRGNIWERQGEWCLEWPKSPSD